MACAAMITFFPLVLVGLAARLYLKLNFTSICGVLAGSMTDPPALAFANTMTGSDAPSVSYATVYPLTMLLRVVAAQLLVLLFLR
jgi:putative transport protein